MYPKKEKEESKEQRMPKSIQESGKYVRWKGLGELNDNEVKKFLLDKNNRKTVTVEYPSDLDEFNRIITTAEGKRDLLTELGILK